jgi:hypothetical protein
MINTGKGAMAATYIAQAYDAQGRPMIDPALSLATSDQAEAEAAYEWLVAGGWPARLLAVS